MEFSSYNTRPLSSPGVAASQQTVHSFCFLKFHGDIVKHSKLGGCQLNHCSSFDGKRLHIKRNADCGKLAFGKAKVNEECTSGLIRGSKSDQTEERKPHLLLPSAKSMEEIYDALAQRLMTAAETATGEHKYFVALAGSPGAGKSTVAAEVVRRVNAAQKEVSGSAGPDLAAAVPMDGFHLYKWQLDCFKDPKEARARRGAPWTFNPEALTRHLARIRAKGSGYLPSFNHGVGDPVERDIFVNPEVRVVVVEGNYLLLDEDSWSNLGPLFDEKWFIDVDLDEAMQRVEKRHVATGKPPDVAKWRISYNDRPNAELIMKTKDRADVIIPSLPEARFGG